MRSHGISETSQRLQLARDLQRSLSPEVLPRLEGYDLAAYSQPAELVGGDCYDVSLNGRLHLVIADATGHGLSAAAYMARTQAYLRSGLAAGQGPAEVLVGANRRLVGERSFRMFTTVVCAQIDPRGRRLRYARAGHNPPFLVRGRQVEELAAGTGPLGLSREFHLEGSSVALEEGDVLVLYTDGLIEALNAQGEPFAEEQLVEVLLRHRDHSAQGILDGVIDAVNDFMRAVPQEDDITMVVLKVGAGGEGGSPALSRGLVGGERRPVALGFVRLEGGGHWFSDIRFITTYF